jgi:hypothetical protein
LSKRQQQPNFVFKNKAEALQKPDKGYNCVSFQPVLSKGLTKGKRLRNKGLQAARKINIKFKKLKIIGNIF